MKFQRGDHVYVEMAVERANSAIGKYTLSIPDDDDRAAKVYADEDHITEIPDMTVNDAWEIAKKILLYPANGGFNASELEEIFGRTEHLWELTPQEAKRKIEVWKESKRIKKDNVVVDKEGIQCIVSLVVDDMCHVVYPNGATNAYPKKDLRTTGKTFPISQILKGF